MDQNNLYPVTYRYDRWRRYWIRFCGAIFVLVGPAITASLLFFAPNPLAPAAWSLIIWPLILWGVYLIGLTFRGQLSLYPDYLEYRGVLSATRINRDDVEGIAQTTKEFGCLIFKAVFKNTDQKKFLTVRTFIPKPTPALDDWFNGIRNLDVKAREDAYQALISNPAFGDTEAKRIKAVKRDGRIQIWIMILSGIMVLWGMVYPEPYQLCMGILIGYPALGILITLFNKKRWTFFDLDDPARFGGVFTIFTAFVVLVMFGRVAQFVLVLDWKPIALTAIVVSATTTLIFTRLEKTRSRPGAIFAWLLLSCHIYLSFLHVNAYYEVGKPVIYPTEVLSLSFDKRPRMYVKPWGPHKTPEDFAIRLDSYRRLKPGDKVCVYVFPGRLGWAWYRPGFCEAGAVKSQAQ